MTKLALPHTFKYAYIINLDEGVLEVYLGDNFECLSDSGRYAGLRDENLYFGTKAQKDIDAGLRKPCFGVKLVECFSFNALQKMNTQWHVDHPEEKPDKNMPLDAIVFDEFM